MKISEVAGRIGSLFGNIPGRSPVTHAVAIAGASAMLAFATGAQAVVVVSPAANVVIPVNTNGIYINVVTGAAGTASGTTGWDINPWGSTNLSFFNPSTPTGGVYAISVTGQVASLPGGTVISSSTTWGSGAASATAASFPWVLGQNNYFGFRFLNEVDGLIHYGYGIVNPGSAFTDPTRAVVSLFYESVAGASITIPAIPEPSSWALMLGGGLSLAGAVVRRRRQAAA
jgi:hypothetical protein